MAKKSLKRRGAENGSGVYMASGVVQPDYYARFRCIGGDCEDSCCIVGWRIDIDHATWQRYQACQDEALVPRIKETVQIESPELRSNARYATMKPLSNGHCAFLSTDGWCELQQHMGPPGLCDTCAVYPRAINQFGRQPEYGLAISCPEAARVALLHSEPTKLVTASADLEFARRRATTLTVDCSPRDEVAMFKMRSLIVTILQWRQVSVGARVMLIGALLSELAPESSGRNVKPSADILATLDSYSSLLSDPIYVENEFSQIAADVPRKLSCTTGFLADFLRGASPRFKECLTAFADGLIGGGVGGEAARSMDILVARYDAAYNEYYWPYFKEKHYILENYLVNEVLCRLFPFVRGTFIELYRAMVFNLAIIQVLLVGIAAHHKGLNDQRVVQLIQCFSQRSDHNDSYIRRLSEALADTSHPSFVEVMWMLKER